MKNSHISLILAAAFATLPLAAIAQSAPQAAVMAASAPGKAAGEVVQLQGKVKSIDKKARSVVVAGPHGNEVQLNAGEEARNFDQIRVGDLVTLTYAQALALELRKVANNGIRERVESEDAMRTKKGEKPGAAIEKTVSSSPTLLRSIRRPRRSPCAAPSGRWNWPSMIRPSSRKSRSATRSKPSMSRLSPLK